MATASSPTTRPTSSNRALDLCAAALLVAISVLIYLPALNGRFLWDDPILIHDNVLLRDVRGLWRIWTTVTSIHAEDHYRPLQYTLHWVEWQLWGGRTTGYHAVNMLLHGVVGIQIWRLMRRLALPGAWIAAALFVAHPVHAEAVAWIFSVKDLLATVFFLFTVEMYLNREERGGVGWLAAAAVGAAAAMLVKTTAVLMPFSIMILVWYRRGRIGSRDLVNPAVLAAVTFSISLFDMYVVRINNIDVQLQIPSFPERLVQSGIALGMYLGKLIVPVGLSPIYPQFQYSLGNPIHWLPLAAALVVTVILWLVRDRVGRGPLACWLFFGVMIGPALGILYFGFLERTPIADRYQYLPSIGPIVGVGALAGMWIRDAAPARRAIRCAPVVLALIALAAGTWRQAGFYRSEATFFGRALEFAESPVAYYNLGSMAWLHKRYAEAERFLTEAYRLEPTDGKTIYALGQAIASQGETRRAIDFYRKVIDSGCVSPNVWANLAWLLATAPDPKVRDPQQALALARECVGRAPKPEAETWNALAAAQAAAGDPGLAARTAREALRLATADNDPYFVKKIGKTIPVYDAGKPYIETPGE
ncbi:MAG: tetratricopeptide repeat protein [Candidatus Sumerlaeia bacterium]